MMLKTVNKSEQDSAAKLRKKGETMSVGGGGALHKKRLAEYITKVCREKKLSLRSLSVNAGLSPGTVHSIIHRDYEPSLYSLNQLADFLGVKRQYLWYVAGLLEEDEVEAQSLASDPRLHYYCEKLSRMPDKTRDLVIGIVADIINYHLNGSAAPESVSQSIKR